MAVYGQKVITEQGLALYAKAQTGAKITFSRLQIGSGKLAAGQDPANLTALISPISNFSINSISSQGSTSSIKGVFENSGLNAPTYSCELGLFAQDPDVGEILYAYANAGDNGDTLPPISSGPFSKQYQINAAIGNAADVTAEIVDGLYALSSDVGDMSTVPTTAKDAAGAITELHADIQSIDVTPPDDSITTAKLAAKSVTQAKIGDKAVGSGQLADGAATDTVIGTRTIDDTVAAAAGADTPTRLWSKLANMIKAVTGKANWYTPPATTIEALNTNKLNASAYTATDVLAKLLTVDGVGSGLDADMLGGYHPSDFALASSIKVPVTGSYNGNGAASRDIALPFTPSAVLSFSRSGPGYPTYSSGLVLNGYPMVMGSDPIMEIGTNKYTVHSNASSNIHANDSGIIYNYIAFP